MALTAAERQRRSRAHKQGDHSLCDSARCADVTPAVTTVTSPGVTPKVTDPILEELGPRGRRLYREVLAEHPKLGARERVVLEEAARVTDRCDQLDRMLAGDGETWGRVEFASGRTVLVIDKAMAEVRQQQQTLARLLGELRQMLAPAKETLVPEQPAVPAGGGKILDLAARAAQLRPKTAG